MSDRPPEHDHIEDRLNHAIARVCVEVQLSNIGKALVKKAIASGVKNVELAEVARTAPRSGWLPIGHVVTLDQFGCRRKVEVRFVKHEDGERFTMSRMLTAGPDGKIHEQE